MTKEDFMAECAEPGRQSITVELPCEMAARIQKIARENNTDPSNILIEALDFFLRRQGPPG